MGPFCSLQTAPRGRQVRVNWNERWRAEACTREPRKLPNTKRLRPSSLARQDGCARELIGPPGGCARVRVMGARARASSWGSWRGWGREWCVGVREGARRPPLPFPILLDVVVWLDCAGEVSASNFVTRPPIDGTNTRSDEPFPRTSIKPYPRIFFTFRQYDTRRASTHAARNKLSLPEH